MIPRLRHAGKEVTPAYRREQKIHRGNSISRINADAAFEFLGFDMPVLRKWVVAALPIP
jgi:hypothetical protein